jgi:uncharacterized membrane protein
MPEIAESVELIISIKMHGHNIHFKKIGQVDVNYKFCGLIKSTVTFCNCTIFCVQVGQQFPCDVSHTIVPVTVMTGP